MAPVPPVEVSNVVRGNTWQGCCTTIEADDDARVVFSNRTNEFKTKTRTYSLFNNIQCCVFGETREERENRRTQNELKKRAIDPHNELDWENVEEGRWEKVKEHWEKVKEELGYDYLGEADPITELMKNRIIDYGKAYRLNRVNLEEPHEIIDDATSRIMSAPTLESLAAPKPSLTPQHGKNHTQSRVEGMVEAKGFFKHKSSNESPVDKIPSTSAVPGVSKKSSKSHSPSAEAKGVSKHKKRNHVTKARSSSVPKVSNWESIEMARHQTDLALEKSITRRFIEEVARQYSDDQIGAVDVEKVLRDFQDFVQKEEEEKRLYEEKMRKVEILVKAVRKRMAENQGCEPPLSHRTMREVIKNVLEADEELEAMYQEMRRETPAYIEEEWLDYEIEDEAPIFDRLRKHLGCSEEISKEHETKVRVVQKVRKKISGKLSGSQGPVTPEKILQVLEDAAGDTLSENPKKEQVEMVVDYED